MDRARRTQQTYDRIAGEFFARNHDRSVLHGWMRKFAGLVPAGVVLDLGCGPCHDSAELRQLGLPVVSVDRSRRMLMLAQQQFPGPRVQADLRHLPFRPRSVAGAWASASLLHLGREELRPALHGIAELLVEQGLLFLSLKDGQGERWDTSRYGPDAPRWFTYFAAEDIDAALGEAGFELLESARQADSRDPWHVRIARRVR